MLRHVVSFSLISQSGALLDHGGILSLDAEHVVVVPLVLTLPGQLAGLCAAC